MVSVLDRRFNGGGVEPKRLNRHTEAIRVQRPMSTSRKARRVGNGSLVNCTKLDAKPGPPYSIMTLIQLYILAALGLASVGEYTAPHYARGVMEQVSRNRDMPVVPCMVASPTIPIGEWVWVWGPNTHTLRHCRVTDTSMPADRARHIRHAARGVGA